MTTLFAQICVLIKDKRLEKWLASSKLPSSALGKWSTSTFLPTEPAVLRGGRNPSHESGECISLSASLSPPQQRLSPCIYSPMRSLEEEELEATIWTQLLLSSVYYLNKDPVGTNSRLPPCARMSTYVRYMTGTGWLYIIKWLLLLEHAHSQIIYNCQNVGLILKTKEIQDIFFALVGVAWNCRI